MSWTNDDINKAAKWFCDHEITATEFGENENEQVGKFKK